MATDISVRQELLKRGVSNDQIGYNQATGTVTVGGRDFMKPPKVINNTSYTDQNSFNTAYDQYQKSLQPKVVQQPQTDMSAISTNTPSTATTSYQPATNYDQMLRSIMDGMNNQEPINPYETASYEAAEQQARRMQRQQTRAAQEAYGAAGAARSVNLGERVAGIAGDTQEYLMTQVVPQIIAQEQAARQQQLQNQFSTLDALMQRDQYGLQVADRTGYMPLTPEAEQAIRDIINLKQTAQSQGVTPEQLSGLTQEASALRSQLGAMGINNVDQLFGSGVTAEQAMQNIAQARIPTMAAQQQQFNQGLQTQQQQLNEMQVMAALTGFLPDGTPTTAEQQRQLENEWFTSQQLGVITPIIAQVYGLQEGTPTFEAQQAAIRNQLDRAQLSISQQNANTNAGQLALSRDRFNAEQNAANQANMDEERMGLVSAIRSGQVTPGQALQQIEQDLALGFYTPEQAEQLKRDLQTIAPTTPTPELTPEQTRIQEDFMANLPSDAELEREAKRLGYPTLEYRSYAKDPRGMVTGISFEQWKQLYGPVMR